MTQKVNPAFFEGLKSTQPDVVEDRTMQAIDQAADQQRDNITGELDEQAYMQKMQVLGYHQHTANQTKASVAQASSGGNPFMDDTWARVMAQDAARNRQ